MKFGLCSDLHLDFGSMNPEFFDWRGDVLFLAGDIGEEDYLRKHEHLFFDGVSKMADRVYYIAGNHEFYGSEIDTAEKHIEEFLEQWKNIYLLKNEIITYGDFEIFGGTMWTDFHGSPIAQMNASLTMNDYKYIRRAGNGYRKIHPNDILKEHQKGSNALLNFLDNDSGLRKIVMTHHAPSMQSVPARYKHDYELNKAYCGHFESLIESYPEIEAWVHGHTHDYFDYCIGETRVICNPRGYTGERPIHLPPYQPFTFEL